MAASAGVRVSLKKPGKRRVEKTLSCDWFAMLQSSTATKPLSNPTTTCGMKCKEFKREHSFRTAHCKGPP